MISRRTLPDENGVGHGQTRFSPTDDLEPRRRDDAPAGAARAPARAASLERAWAYDRVPFHKRRLDAAGVVAGPDSFARRSPAPAVHGQVRPARALPGRSLRRPALGDRPHPRVERHEGEGRPSSGTRARTSTTWAEVCARSLACGGAHPGQRHPRRLRLRALHRRARRSLRCGAIGRAHRAGIRR